MLGWEFPPRLSGGLGTACRGLTRGLTSVGTEVLFVLPRGSGQGTSASVRLMNCDRVPILAEQRWAASGARRVLGSTQHLDPYSGRSVHRFGRNYDFRSEVERYARAVGEIARVKEFDVIHAHDWMSFPAGMFAKELSGKPLVAHVHSLERDRSGADADQGLVAIERAGLEACDQVLCVSRATAEAVAEHYAISRSKLRVMHNAVEPVHETAQLRPESLHEKVLFLGRVTGQKDPATFLRAAALVRARLPRVRFLIAGDGDLLPDMVALQLSLGLENTVRFTGFLEEDEVNRLYREADVFVLPSRSEPFGLVALEAMAHGVPVIATRGSGVLETLPSALVVESGDVRGLAERIVALLTRTALRRTVLESGAREVARATWESRGHELSELYEELAS